MREYLTSPDIFSANPTLNALTRTISPEEVERKILELRSAVRGAFQIEAVDGSSLSGGGAFPVAEIPTRLIAIRSSRLSAEELTARLRRSTPPIISRRSENRVLLDLRTVKQEDWKLIVEAFKRISEDH